MADYYAILTEAGHAAVATALGGGADVDFAQLAVGDGSGAYHEPAADQVALVNERWRGALNRRYVHPTHPEWVVLEAIIPANVGGWDIREAGLFAPGSPGTLLAVGKYPLTNKPAPGGGSEKSLYVRIVLSVTNGAAVIQEFDNSLVMATQQYVDDHAALTSPHAATSAPTASRLVVRDPSGRAQVATPAAAGDIATKGYVDGLRPRATSAPFTWQAAGMVDFVHGLGAVPWRAELVAKCISAEHGYGVGEWATGLCLYDGNSGSTGPMGLRMTATSVFYATGDFTPRVLNQVQSSQADWVALTAAKWELYIKAEA